MAQLERHLAEHPFAAPEKPDLDRWRLGVRELAAAERTGRIVRLADDVVLLPTGPAQAMRRAGGAGTAVHHQRGPAGAGHHPAGGDSAAGAPGPARLDPAFGRRAPPSQAAVIAPWRTSGRRWRDGLPGCAPANTRRGLLHPGTGHIRRMMSSRSRRCSKRPGALITDPGASWSGAWTRARTAYPTCTAAVIA